MNNIIVQDVGAEKDAITSLRAPTHFGRPNWDRVFSSIAEKHPDTDVGVFFCGPAVLSRQLHHMSNKYSHPKGTKFFFGKGQSPCFPCARAFPSPLTCLPFVHRELLNASRSARGGCRCRPCCHMVGPCRRRRYCCSIYRRLLFLFLPTESVPVGRSFNAPVASFRSSARGSPVPSPSIPQPTYCSIYCACLVEYTMACTRESSGMRARVLCHIFVVDPSGRNCTSKWYEAVLVSSCCLV